MKKIVKIIVILNLIIIPMNVNATKGCCSHHGGVDCSRVQSNGKVICNDGNTSSSCDYSSMAKCQGYNPSSNSNKNNSSSSSNNKNNSSSNNSSQKNNSSNNSKKSSIATISSLQINNENIAISDNMKYSTHKSTVNITYKTTDTKAQVKINKPVFLDKGINNVEIIVTAEDGTKKIYNIEVTKLENNPEPIPNEDTSKKESPKENIDKNVTNNKTNKEEQEEESDGILATLSGIFTIVGGVMIYKKIKEK